MALMKQSNTGADVPGCPTWLWSTALHSLAMVKRSCTYDRAAHWHGWNQVHATCNRGLKSRKFWTWIASLLVLSNTLLCISICCVYATAKMLPGGGEGVGEGAGKEGAKA